MSNIKRTDSVRIATQSANALSEITNKLNEEVTAHKQHLEEKAELNSKKNLNLNSGNSQRIKNNFLFRKKVFSESFDNLIEAVVRQALPFDISGVSLNEHKQQIRTIVLENSELFETSHYTNSHIPKPDSFRFCELNENYCEDDGEMTKLTYQIGSIGSSFGGKVVNTPVSLAKNVLWVNAHLCESRLGEPLSSAENYVDDVTVYGSEAEHNMDKTETQKCFAETFNSLQKRIATAIAAPIRENVMKDIKSASKETPDNSHLSEGMQALENRKNLSISLKNQKPTLVGELFKHNKVLNESVGSSNEDYLNEAVFQATVLETYNMFGCVKEDAIGIAKYLRKKRNSFLKG